MEEQEQLLRKISELEEEIKLLKGEDDEDTVKLKAFFDKYPEAEGFADELCAYIENADGPFEVDSLGDALIKILFAKYQTPEALAADADFLNKHIYSNEKIKDKFVNDYIDSIKKTPSACVKRTGLALTQKEKPSSIRAAGELARALFKK